MQVRSASVRVLLFALNLSVYFLIRSVAPKGNHQGFSDSLHDLVALCSRIEVEILILGTIMHTNILSPQIAYGTCM